MIYQEVLEPAGRLVCLALRANRKAEEVREVAYLYDQLGDEECIAAANANKVLPKLASALVQCIPADRLSPRWSELSQVNGIRVAKLTDALRECAASWKASGCAYAVVEGGGVLLGSDLPLHDYCSGDFDITVAHDDLVSARKALEDVGFRYEQRPGRPPWYRLEFGRPADGTTLWVALGHLPFDRSWVPLNYRDRSAVWLSRRLASRKFPDVEILDPSDALAFVCGHTSIHSYLHSPGIRLHVDVDRLVSDNQIDWSRFLSEVRAVGMPTRAFVALSIAVGLLNTPVPHWVLVELFPGRVRWGLIQTILAAERVLADQAPKLGPAKAVALEALLEESGPFGWARLAIAPPRDWLTDHFGDPDARRRSLWTLQYRRIADAGRRWRPLRRSAR